MNDKNICKICGGEATYLCEVTEHFIINTIKSMHSEWVEDDGACPKCIEYYQRQIKQ